MVTVQQKKTGRWRRLTMKNHRPKKPLPDIFKYRKPRYFIDIETISSVDLKKHGVVRYAEDKSTRIVCICIYDAKTKKMHKHINNELKELYSIHELADGIPSIFIQILTGAETYAAHNILFEHFLLKQLFESSYNYDSNLQNGLNHSFEPELWDTAAVAGTCTKDLCALRGLGNTRLGDAAETLSLSHKKDVFGELIIAGITNTFFIDEKAALKKLSPKAHKEKIATVEKQHGDFNLKDSIKKHEYGYYFMNERILHTMVAYCELDAILSYEVYNKLKLTPNDKDFGPMSGIYYWQCQQVRAANIRGVNIDMRVVDALVKAGDQYQKLTKEVVNNLFDGLNPTQHAKLAPNMKADLDTLDIDMFGVNATALNTYLIKLYKIINLEHQDPGDKSFNRLAQKMVTKIKALQEASATTYRRAHKVKDQMSLVDGHIYGMLVFCGASTTNRNASRGVQLQNLPRPSIDVKEIPSALETIEQGDSNKMNDINWLKDAVLSLPRAMIIPRLGYKFFDVDLGQIELRNSLYHTKQFKELEILHKKDLYIEFAETSIFGHKVEKSSKERSTSKTTILGSTYNAGPSKLEETIIKQTGELPIISATELYNKFHARFPAYKKYYEKYKQKIDIARASRILSLKLASGRKLTFKNICLREFILQTTKKMYRGISYKNFKYPRPLKGHTVFNNIIQGESADIFRIVELDFAIEHWEYAYLILNVHDQSLFEVPEGADLIELTKSWKQSGSHIINKCWPGLLLDSEAQLCDHLYK